MQHKIIMIITYQFRIKDSSRKTKLKALASKVNFVWNYLNETSEFAWRRDRKWLSNFDFNYLMIGASKELGLLSDSISKISSEFVFARNKAKKCKLSWRSKKRNLGWIPFTGRTIHMNKDSFVYQSNTYKVWKSRDFKGVIKSGCFSENTKGQWFVNLNCEVLDIPKTESLEEVGIDLGLKTTATMSNGIKIENPQILKKYEQKLAMANKARKKKLVTNIQNKIKNVRKDFLHKESTKLVKKYKSIYVGDVSSLKLVKTRMAKSVYDAGWGMLKTMLEYKAIRLGVEFKVVKEKYSSVTCSSCLKRTGPSGLSALGVREWVCSNCGLVHDRDVNAATNILLGLER